MECEAFRDDQLDVLYGEADAATARRVSEHHAVCAACRDEMASLRRVRRDLTAWSVPEGVVPRPAAAPRTAGWLAVAAALVAALGAGLVLSGSELRHEQGALTLRMGPGQSGVEALLARQEARHRAEMDALRRELRPSAQAAATPVAGSDEALLRRVEEMVRQSEARQDARFTARLAAFGEQAETQRRYDLARVSAGLSYLEGKTGQDVVRTTELMGYVLQASQQK